MNVTSRSACCRWNSWLLLLLVLREVKEREPWGRLQPLTCFHTLEKAPLMRRRACALLARPPPADLHNTAHLNNTAPPEQHHTPEQHFTPEQHHTPEQHYTLKQNW